MAALLHSQDLHSSASLNCTFKFLPSHLNSWWPPQICPFATTADKQCFLSWISLCMRWKYLRLRVSTIWPVRTIKPGIFNNNYKQKWHLISTMTWAIGRLHRDSCCRFSTNKPAIFHYYTKVQHLRVVSCEIRLKFVYQKNNLLRWLWWMT